MPTSPITTISTYPASLMVVGAYREEHEPGKGRDHTQKLEGVLGNLLFALGGFLPSRDHRPQYRLVAPISMPSGQLVGSSGGRDMIEVCIVDVRIGW